MITKHQLHWILRFSKTYKYKLFYYFLFELLGLSFSLAFIWFSKRSIDRAVHHGSESLSMLLLVTASCIILSFACMQFAAFLNERNKALMLVDLQKLVLKKQISVPWDGQKKHTGDLMVRVLNDTQEIVTAAAQTLIACLISLLKIVAATWFLYWMDPWLAAVLLLITPLLLFSKFYFRKLRDLQKSLKLAESQLGKTIQDNLRLRLLIRSMNQDKPRWERIEKDQGEIFGIKKRLIGFSLFSRGIWGLGFSISYIVTFVWGILSLNDGLITVGTMSAFLQLVIRLQAPVATLVGYLPALVRVGSSVERLEELLNEPSEEIAEHSVLNELDELRLSNVSLQVEGKLLTCNLSFLFKRGEPTLVFGSSGLGKSTMLRAILGLIDPQAGAIVLKEGSQNRLMNATYRCNFAFVPQGEKLFNGTIRENLLFGNDWSSEVQLKHALGVACAEFVWNLPEGLDTVVGESGFGLSEGQIQRLAIARAILLPAKVWLFDEVTSALDQQTAHKLVTNLLEIGADKILIFVTHDLSQKQYFKHILEMRENAMTVKQ
ncbi:ATP-binding cassette domain-containing protein [Sphingobacterium sp. DK4209]|uniref:ATP-binding cassette domain-containing protein n=1 Tax=Sphingobacterium zhuxiongii TaxID=2662364 RepID=A0A5Q0QF65_9SPHI|nr:MULTISPECIES: ABC transporter ATP-binding protein [unclassified Sphingobacterium]MVZ65745.1 ATP-binding cassette domain-containing protein [Sphingobacterium sp. DK4209]QGA27944.1 ATP-binding cassette domain-containing protein [Sphingobacterium sp. dk4302]